MELDYKVVKKWLNITLEVLSVFTSNSKFNGSSPLVSAKLDYNRKSSSKYILGILLVVGRSIDSFFGRWEFQHDFSSQEQIELLVISCTFPRVSHVSVIPLCKQNYIIIVTKFSLCNQFLVSNSTRWIGGYAMDGLIRLWDYKRNASVWRNF